MRIFITLVLIFCASFINAQEISDTTKQQTQLNNLIANAGFENGKAGWVNSGGTFAISTSSPLFGKQKATFTASAASQYFETTAVPVPVGLQGQDCLASATYNGADSNLYLSVFDGASVELVPALSRATLNSSSGQKNIKLYFTCPSSGSVKIRVASTAASVIGSFDNFSLDKSDAEPVKQAQFLGDVYYGASINANTASTTFVDASVVNSPTYTNLTAPTVNRIGFRIPNMPKGRYKIIASGFVAFVGSTTSNTASIISFASSDIATADFCGYLGTSGNTSGVTDVRSAASFVCEYNNTSDQTNKEFWLKMKAENGTASLFNTIGSRISVYYYPAGSDVVINSKCPNDIACANEFSTSAGATGIVTKENLDFINGNCSSSGSIYTCNFNSLIFSQAPNCSVVTDINTNGSAATIDSISSTQVVYRTFITTTAASTDFPVRLFCQRASGDYKPRQDIPAFLSSTVTSSLNNVRSEFASIGGPAQTSCTSTPCTIDSQSGFVSSVTRSSTGDYLVNMFAGIWSLKPTCTCSATSVGVSARACTITQATNTTSLNVIVHNGSTNFDGYVNLKCDGIR
jgi:hypothetical protein